MALSFSFVILISLIGTVKSTLGFDGIDSMSSSTFSCMSSNGYSFFIGRVFRASGVVDTTGIENIKNARDAGWTKVDGYIFPCTTDSCASPASQISEIDSALKQAAATVGVLWLDIEMYKWGQDFTNNINIIVAMGNALESLGYEWGVYTNMNNWNSIVGHEWNGLSSKPLWWNNYNKQQSLDNFVPFGGWSKPTIHQYEGDVDGPCGFGIDNNYF